MSVPAGSTVPGLARKVRKVLDIRTESLEVLNSLAALSGVYQNNSTASRRQLKANIEERSISTLEQFLYAAQAVFGALQDVQGELDALSSGCSAINAALAADRTSSADLLAESDKLQHELAVSETRSGLVNSFFEQYQLSSAEISALQDAEIGDTFFNALERVGSIHRSCRNLLSSHHHRAGLELMDAMSTYQETAYERLCRWVQGECASLGDMDAPEVDPRLHRAAEALRERQVLFRYCAEEVATARHNAMFQRFIAALTRGGPNGMPRPIEMNAHDPRRYLGDMLAWVHQALASERELLISLFGQDNQSRTSGSHADSPSDVPSSSALLDKVLEGVCRPLKIRIEQVLTANLPLVLCFKVSQLLAFYGRTVEQMMGSGARLTDTLVDCHKLANRVFHEQLTARGNKLMQFKAAPPKDLALPQQVTELLHQLRELITTFVSAFNSNQEQRKAEKEFAPILDAIVDPALQMCKNSSALLTDKRVGKSPEPAAEHIFLINCLAAIRSVLEDQDCCQSKHLVLTKDIQQHLMQLVDENATRILQSCGFKAQLEHDRDEDDQRQWKIDLPNADTDQGAQQILKCMQSFFELITQDQLPQFRHLQAPDVKQAAASELGKELHRAYTLVYNAAKTHQQLQQSIEHTPDQVKTILGIM